MVTSVIKGSTMRGDARLGQQAQNHLAALGVGLRQCARALGRCMERSLTPAMRHGVEKSHARVGMAECCQACISRYGSPTRMCENLHGGKPMWPLARDAWHGSKACARRSRMPASQ